MLQHNLTKTGKHKQAIVKIPNISIKYKMMEIIRPFFVTLCNFDLLLIILPLSGCLHRWYELLHLLAQQNSLNINWTLKKNVTKLALMTY